MKTEIGVRRNQKEKCWEVVVNFGIYGRLFHYKAEAELYAEDLRKMNALSLEVELAHPAGLKRIER